MVVGSNPTGPTKIRHLKPRGRFPHDQFRLDRDGLRIRCFRRRIDAPQQGFRRRLHVAPVFAQRLDDRGDDQPFDIGARRVMGAEPATLRRIERLFEQRAEDRRLDFVPVLLRLP